jgi:hypothetical protein
MQVVSKVGVRVRHRIRKIHQVLVIFKSVCERQCVKLLRMVSLVLLHPILVVEYIVTFPSPALPFLVGSGLRVDSNFHAIVKQTVRLSIVQYTEFDCVASFGVRNFEVKPLSIPSRVDVILHEQVVFCVRHFLR